MKKLLLSTAAVCGLAVAVAAPAKASDLELGISGFFLGYGVYNNQDENTGESNRNFDLRKETEVHFTGETTLDNGLTVGVVVETNMDREDDNSNNTVEESYMYLSGGWGRVNVGEEDSATFLLQVAAPAADENIDGIRPLINSFNMQTASSSIGDRIDVLSYDHDVTGYTNKITYFTPVFNGFQAGVSYTPGIDDLADKSNLAPITADDDADHYDDAIEAAVRFEGSFEEIDLALGAGFTEASREVNTAAQDDRQVWNVGADFDWGPFGLGVAYMEDNNGIEDRGDTNTFVIGADYITGPYRFGVSYLNQDHEQNSGRTVNAGTGVLEAGELETARWTGGVTYEYGPGMSFRGSIAFIQNETASAADQENDGYQITVGTQVNF